MKNKLFILLLAFFNLAISAETQKVVYLSDPMLKLARVNETEIYFRDIMDLYNANLKKFQDKKVELSRSMHDYFVNGLIAEKIDETIMIADTDKLGIKADTAKVSELLTKLKSKFTSQEEYNSYLKKRAMTEDDAQKKIEDRLKISAFQNQLFKDIKVTEEDALNFYKANEKNINPPEAFNVSQIMLYYPENASDIEKSFLVEKLQGIRKKILNGADFSTEAKANSEGASAANGGMIGWVDPNSSVDPRVISELKKIKKGEITPVITSSGGVHILKLLEYRPEAPKKDFATIKNTLIENITMQKKQGLLASFLENAKKAAKIEIYSKQQ